MGNLMAKAIFKNKKEMIKQAPETFFTIEANDIDGKLVKFKDLQGKHKAFLVTNVACKWGLTSKTYTQFVDLYDKYKDMGLTILAFPCNQFFNQESESETNIKKFVEKNFNVKFPMFSKVEVNGEDAHPLFKFLRNNSELYDPKTNTAKQIPWNFAKFLLDRNGKVVGFYSPRVDPIDMEKDIEKLLKD